MFGAEVIEGLCMSTGLTIRGTGGFTLPLIENKELLEYLESQKDSAWLEEKTGIKTHSLNFDCSQGSKIDNTISSIDYAEYAARQAMANAGLSAENIDHLCLATCTPSQLHFMRDVIELHRRLGLRKDVVVDQIDGGCAALAKAFQTVEIHARYSNKYPNYNALIVATNDVSSFLDKERYKTVQNAWLSPVVFADGAGALILGPGDGMFLARTYCAVDGNHPLVEYLGGGAEYPTNLATLDKHTYIMDARDVATQFSPAMERVLDNLLWYRKTISIENINKWYIHQANLRLIEHFVKENNISMDLVPHNVDVFGNTVSASTLLLLHRDILNREFPNDGPVIFIFVGAGMMEGGALFLG